MIIDDNHNNNDRTDNNNMSNTIEMKSIDNNSKKLDIPTSTSSHITSRHHDLYNNNNSTKHQLYNVNGKVKTENNNNNDAAINSNNNTVAQVEADSASGCVIPEAISYNTNSANKKVSIGKRTIKRENGSTAMSGVNSTLNRNR